MMAILYIFPLQFLTQKWIHDMHTELYLVTMSPAHATEAYEGVEVKLNATSALDGSGQLHDPDALSPK